MATHSYTLFAQQKHVTGQQCRAQAFPMFCLVDHGLVVYVNLKCFSYRLLVYGTTMVFLRCVPYDRHPYKPGLHLTMTTETFVMLHCLTAHVANLKPFRQYNC